jgi:hypothetical protein
MTYRPPFIDPAAITIDAPHPATIEVETLLEQCDLELGKRRGPGGQHRAAVASGVHLLHRPTGIEAQATERRSPAVNQSRAVRRLRLRLAVKVRTIPVRSNFAPSELWQRRRQGTRIAVNPDHADYPALLAEALDLVVVRRWDLAGAAGLLGVTMSQLSRLIRQHPAAFAKVNEGRVSVGLSRLRS